MFYALLVMLCCITSRCIKTIIYQVYCYDMYTIYHHLYTLLTATATFNNFIVAAVSQASAALNWGACVCAPFLRPLLDVPKSSALSLYVRRQHQRHQAHTHTQNKRIIHIYDVHVRVRTYVCR